MAKIFLIISSFLILSVNTISETSFEDKTRCEEILKNTSTYEEIVKQYNGLNDYKDWKHLVRAEDVYLIESNTLIELSMKSYEVLEKVEKTKNKEAIKVMESIATFFNMVFLDEDGE